MDRTNWLGWALGAMVVIGGGCNKSTEPNESGAAKVSSGEEAPAAPGPGNTASAACGCPMDVPGTTVSAVDVDGGIALAFTTDTEHVTELRTRVHELADMHEKGTCPGHAHGPHMGQGMGQGARGEGNPGEAMIDATAAVEDTPSGALLVFKPRDALALDSLREQVRKRAERMADHSCPMMQHREKAQPSADRSQSGTRRSDA